MPASLLYHTNQIENVQDIKKEFLTDKIVYRSIFEPKQSLCPCCGHDDLIAKGSKERKLRMAPLGNKMAFLIVKIQRLQCINCLKTWWPPLPFAKQKKTRDFVL